MAGLRTNNRARTARVERMVEKAIMERMELKQYMFDQGGTVATTAGTILNLSQFIIQGDSFNQRDGMQIFMEKVRIRFNGSIPTLGVFANLRFILFQDTQAHGAPPLVIDVLEIAGVNSTPNIVQQQGRRFRILKDHTMSLCANGKQTQLEDFTMGVKRKVTYNGTTSVSTANGPNSLFILIITDLGANSPVYSFDVLMSFRDA